MRFSSPFRAALLTAALFAAPASANEGVSAERLDPCLRSINVMGASVGHVEKKAPDGKSMLHFIVRSNGAEYDVACETDTGLVKDVSAHVRAPREGTAN